MRVKFGVFDDTAGNSVGVNPLLVRYIVTYDQGETTTIYFDRDHVLVVKGSPDAILCELTDRG